MGWGVEADCQDESTHVGPQELGGQGQILSQESSLCKRHKVKGTARVNLIQLLMSG